MKIVDIQENPGGIETWGETFLFTNSWSIWTTFFSSPNSHQASPTSALYTPYLRKIRAMGHKFRAKELPNNRVGCQ